MSYDLVVVGSSWGGLHALTTVLGGLPPSFSPTVVVAQHQSSESQGALVDLLARRCPLEVRWAEDKDPIRRGTVLVGPPDYHVLIDGDVVALSIDDRVRYSRPSIDVLFESAAYCYGQRTVGLVLTGSNQDGAAGLSRIRRAGGLTLVQDPETAEKREMPEAAIALGTR